MLKLTVYTLCLLALMGPTFAMNGKCPDFLEEACTNIHEKCAKETGVNEDLIVQAREAKFSEDEAFKNYLLCIFKSYNFIKDDKIDVETILKALPESVKDQYSPFIKECGFKDAGNIVDSVSATMKCYASTSPELFWVP